MSLHGSPFYGALVRIAELMYPRMSRRDYHTPYELRSILLGSKRTWILYKESSQDPMSPLLGGPWLVMNGITNRLSMVISIVWGTHFICS